MYFGYEHAYELTKEIKDLEDKEGMATFHDLMFNLKLNPGILNRLLKSGVQINIISKENKGYKLSELGKVAYEHATVILALN
jgi:predicted transcriptional regulator